jgi:hypothetical protein
VLGMRKATREDDAAAAALDDALAGQHETTGRVRRAWSTDARLIGLLFASGTLIGFVFVAVVGGGYYALVSLAH